MVKHSLAWLEILLFWDLRVCSRNESSELLAAPNDLDIRIKTLMEYLPSCCHESFLFKGIFIRPSKRQNYGFEEWKQSSLFKAHIFQLKADMCHHIFQNVTVFCCVTYHGSLVPVWVPFPTLHPDFLSLVPKRILVWSQGRWGHIVCTLWWQDATAQPVLLCPLVFRAHNVGLCLICVKRQKGNMLPQVREQCCVLVWGGHPVSAAKR